MGTLPAFLAAWGPVDLSFGSGQGVKCTHSEHLYGELWHRAFTVCPDTPLCDYVLSFGANVEASGGVCGVKRHADARNRGMKRVQIEPHLSVTGACSAEWIPIKPKTDSAFLFAMIHVLLHEHAARKTRHSVSERAHLVALSDRPRRIFPARRRRRSKPLVIDLKSRRAVPFDTPGHRSGARRRVHGRRHRGRRRSGDHRRTRAVAVAPRLRASGRACESLFAGMGGDDLRRAGRQPSAASPTNSWRTPVSARRSRSKA